MNELEDISGYISKAKYNIDNGDELSEMITMVVGYLARLPKLEADAEYLYNCARGTAANLHRKESATVFREVIAEETATEQKIFKYVHRLNSNLPEILQGIRSQLSYLKEQAPRKQILDILTKVQKLSNEIEKLKRQIGEKL